jgi:purine nucleosidase
MDSFKGPQPIIIDTDPGQDDAIAILFALGAGDRLQVRALTTVAGNVPLELTSRNARIIRDWAGRTDIPVYAGCSRPLARDLITAEHVHGETGLGGVQLSEPRAGLAGGDAVNFLIETLGTAPAGSLTICSIGPLTNIASAFIQAPGIRSGIKEIVMMGGAHFQRGNITPSAEFNVYIDPHAADLVFRSGVPITVLPLDVTHQVLTTPSRLNQLSNLGNKAGKLVADILNLYERHDIERFGLEGGPLHDPCVIAYVLNPELFCGKEVNVSVETTSELTLGETVVDWHEVTGRRPNAYWINQVNAEGLFELLAEKIAHLP